MPRPAARRGSGARRAGSAALAAVLASALAAAPASAQSLHDRHYSIDLFQGPILAPSDVIGIGGAYAGYAEGIAGMVANAAAPAVREPFSVSYLEVDGSGSISLPIKLFDNNDFDNSGKLDFDYSNFFYATVGGLLQYGPFGAGVNVELQRYTLKAQGGGTTDVFVGKYHALAAVRLLGDQLALGAGARLATLGLAAKTQLTMFGAAPEIGFLIKPDWSSFRVGGTVRLAVDGGPLLGDAKATGLTLPDHVVLPWEIELGAAVQVGPRPLNPAWIDPREQAEAVRRSFARRREARRAAERAELAALRDPTARAARERALADEEAPRAVREAEEERKVLDGLEHERRARHANWPREHLLFTAEILVTGPVPNGVSLQGFLAQNDHSADHASDIGTSGAHVSFSPRLGVEGEPVPGLLHTRAGTYYEPSRYGSRVGRQHFTFGADLRLFTTTWFGLVHDVTYKLQTYADFSPRYQSVSLGLGVWH